MPAIALSPCVTVQAWGCCSSALRASLWGGTACKEESKEEEEGGEPASKNGQERGLECICESRDQEGRWQWWIRESREIRKEEEEDRGAASQE